VVTSNQFKCNGRILYAIDIPVGDQFDVAGFHRMDSLGLIIFEICWNNWSNQFHVDFERFIPLIPLFIKVFVFKPQVGMA
jgi:hypothetical protein